MKQGPFSGKKALVVVLGVHGGGVANAKWLRREGAQVVVTDERDPKTLRASLAQFTPDEKRAIRFVLGGQREKDFRAADIVVFGPGVHEGSRWRAFAAAAGKRIENDASLFLRYVHNPVVAVTGTRGKTTVTLWIAELLKRKYSSVRPSGNTPDNALLREIDRIAGKAVPAVCELSSWQLELAPAAERSAHIAVITNLFPDHLNTYRNIAHYADAKAGIFAHQREDDMLILNRDNKWWKHFVAKKPRGRLYFTSTKSLPRGVEGTFVRGGKAVLRKDGHERELFSVAKFAVERGEHNAMNLLQAALAALLLDPDLRISERDILKLPSAPMRQEVVAKKGRITVVNDSCATSPDGTIAAIRHFSSPPNRGRVGGGTSKLILIAGGTNKELEFGELAKVIKRYIPPERLILLEGSATAKLIAQLKKRKYHTPEPKKTLNECVDAAFALARRSKGKTTILFSPGAASFEKFLHEFDRGEQWNDGVRKAMNIRSRRRPRKVL